jgi:hypothetical protein
MATELKSHTAEVTLTRFFGGSDRGTCVQVTAGRGFGGDFVQLTRAQAAALAADLLDFAQGRETEDFG